MTVTSVDVTSSLVIKLRRRQILVAAGLWETKQKLKRTDRPLPTLIT